MKKKRYRVHSEGEDSQEYEKFIISLLAEVTSNSDIKVIYPMLDQRQHLLNARFAKTLQQVAQRLTAQHSVASDLPLNTIPILWLLLRQYNCMAGILFIRKFLIEYILVIINNLSGHISQFPLGSRSKNIEIAITGYQIVLNNRKPGSEKYAQTQNNLAAAYSDRINGSRADNLERAIEFYHNALTVLTLEALPEEWANTQNNLAIAYSNRINGSRAENLERAIDFCKASLTIRTFEAFSEKWANTQNNLAIAYSNRINGSRAENLERAIEFYEAALTVYTFENFGEDWAMTQNNLANAYSNRINGSRAENLERAIEFYHNALTVLTLQALPEKWAQIQNNLAVAYSNRINGSRAENLERAIEFYEAALTIRTFEASPEKWAETQNNLALAYTDRINGSRAENLERAIEFYHNALTVRTLEDFPEKWAETQNNLALAYTDRINGSRAENLERAIEFYEAALTIVTREAFPQKHTEDLSNLGNFHRRNQQWQLAYDTYVPAIETVEFLRGEIQSGDQTKQKLAEEWNQLYLGMIEVCIELKCYTEAVEYADRSKAQNLVELLSVKDLYPQGEIPSEVRRELQQLRLKIAEENQRLKQTKDKNYDIINQLRQDLAAKYPYTPLKFGEIQQLGDETSAIAEWYILGDSFCVFTIANNQIHFWQSSPQDLQRLTKWAVAYFTQYYENRDKWREQLAQGLRIFAKIFHIDEIVKNIPETCNKLILIPHRYLHLFPIHALPVSREIWQRFHPDNKNCPLNPCLVDCFDNGVSCAPSCQILHQVQKYKRGKFDKLFAIQNPEDNLLAADIEVETIKNIFLNSDILAKGNAKKGEKSETKLEIAEKAADSHHLFFSCHGSFNPNDPLQSGLQLADGTLTLEEIIRYFNLSECSLVTLSACETGQVQPDDTDEYISLTSGFLLAGSPSLYVSLWSVNAFSTAILMIKTYENLSQQPGKFALSLNQAQIWMRDTNIQGFLDWTNQCHLLDQKWRETLKLNMEIELKNLGTNAKIYQNPYHWAGFCAAGKGEQKYE
jgi:CHAT domain-containing protein